MKKPWTKEQAKTSLSKSRREKGEARNFLEKSWTQGKQGLLDEVLHPERATQGKKGRARISRRSPALLSPQSQGGARNFFRSPGPRGSKDFLTKSRTPRRQPKGGKEGQGFPEGVPPSYLPRPLCNKITKEQGLSDEDPPPVDKQQKRKNQQVRTRMKAK